jgi:hypothetical protein
MNIVDSARVMFLSESRFMIYDFFNIAVRFFSMVDLAVSRTASARAGPSSLVSIAS